MTTLTALEITYNYPDYTKIESFQDKNTKKFGSIMYRLKDSDYPEIDKCDKVIHKIMLSYQAIFDTEEIAIDAMKKVAEEAIEYIKNKDNEKGSPIN